MLRLSSATRMIAAVVLVVATPMAAPVADAAQDADAVPQIVSEDARQDGVALSVRIQGRLTEADLKRVADTLRLRRAAGKPPIESLAFYLPGMDIAGQPWADATFAPDPRVVVKGLRREEQDAYRAEASADARDVVGVWLTSSPAPLGLLTIYREPGRKLFAEWRLRNGHKSVDEIYESVGNRGRRYDIAGSDGGYYLALWSGALQLGDRSSVIAVAERLTFEKKALEVIAAPPSVGAGGKGAAGSALPPAAGVTTEAAVMSVSKSATARREAAKGAKKWSSDPTLSDALATALRGS
ncbi:MAG: hypothetical protein ACT4OU_11745 [Hyphomicrobium sp.]